MSAPSRTQTEVGAALRAAEGLYEEIVEAEMNLGLALQHLAGVSRARVQDCITAYQRALRTFDRMRHPKEFAILRNNLATAFLSIPFTDERARMREALAVQPFEEALRVVTLVDHPDEYAMLQGNLGNAQRYASSSHPLESGFRALEAHDEALRVRTRRDTPVEYANTLANETNCLSNLPDDSAAPEGGNPAYLRTALALHDEAAAVFGAHGVSDKAAMVAETAAQLRVELAAMGHAGRATMTVQGEKETGAWM